MKVGLYVRVSTDIQAREGDSIPAQLSALRNYAKEHNHEVVAEFVDDGISGETVEPDPPPNQSGKQTGVKQPCGYYHLLPRMLNKRLFD